MTSQQDLLLYNALDAACTLECHNAFWKDLQQDGFEKTYRLTVDLFPAIIYMQTRGIRVDKDALETTKTEILSAAAERQEELNRLCGRPLNVNSPRDCAKYFYVELGLPPFYNDKGEVTVDDMALQRLAKGTKRRPGLRQAKLVQEIRSLRKLYGTYLNIEFDPDGRMRCAYNPRGTRFGRLSSSRTIFGTGTNTQNLPPEFKRFLVADEGKVLWEVDKRQAEWVVVAYLTGDSNMIKVVESGLDAHLYTASLMFNAPMELLAEEAKLIGNSTDPEYIRTQREEHPRLAEIASRLPRTMSARQCGKRCVVGETEVLTPTGWKPIEVLSPGEKIACWRLGEIFFEEPQAIHKYYTDEPLVDFETLHLHQLVTPDHRMPIINDRTRQLTVVPARALMEERRSHRCIPLSGILDSRGCLTPMELRFIAMVQADATIDMYQNIILKVSKPRKVNRAKQILDSLGLRYTVTTRGFFIHKSNDLCRKVAFLLGRNKVFGSFILNTSTAGLLAFITEVCRWDGYEDRMMYFSTVKENAVWVQTIAHLIGMRATFKEKKPSGFGKKPLYIVKIGKADNTAVVSLKVREVPYTGFVYCPTVSSGFFLIRYKNKISVTGNSNHGLNYDEGYVKFAMINEMDQTEAKRIWSLYHTTYPGLRLWYESVKRQLQKDRTLTNCFGRKVRFLDAWGPDLWKSAYAMLPQSTVVDSLNIGMAKIYADSWLTKDNDLEILAQVHDSLLLQIPRSVYESPRFKEVKDRVFEYVSPTIEYNSRQFKIATDMKVGLNWGIWHPERNPEGMREVKGD